jgi:hypothetical protein
MRNANKYLLLATAIFSVAMLSAKAEDKFTIAVCPDTQREISSGHTAVFLNAFQWMAANAADLNLKFVLHTGDMVDWDTPDHAQYKVASDGYAYLDAANIPYAISPGNHDTGAVDVGGSAKPPPNSAHVNVRDTTTFNTYFPPSRYKKMGGTYEAGKEDNSWHEFTAGGLNWLVISMEFCARTGPVNWAKSVIAAHPNHNVIFILHYHLEGDSTISNSNAGYGDNTCRYIYDNLLSQYSNVRLVFCGHVGIQGYRTDVGPKGNTIYQFLGTYHDSTINPTRLVEIDTKNGTIDTRVFIPSTGGNKQDGSARVITGIPWVQPAAPTTPAAPTGLNATTTSSSQINLAWNDTSSNETGFKIERKTGAGGTWSQIATTGASVSTYTNTGLSASTQYFYRLRANNASGDSAYSNEANATTQAPPPTVPAAPSNMTATATSSTQVSLSWTDNSNNETGFKLEGKTGATGNWTQIALVGANVTSWNGSGLTPNTQYFFRVRATNAAGDSAYSNEGGTTTKPALLVGTGTGLRGEYYDNADFTAFKISRVDATVAFDWGTGSPDATLAADTFSVRWNGQVQAQISETYTFYTNSDDGVRLWVNGVKLIDNWTDHAPTENSGTIALTSGTKYNIRIDWYENGGGAVAQLLWSSPSTPKQIVPKTQLYPAAANAAPTLASGPTATPNPATTFDTIAFSVVGSDPNGDALTYTWNFGDGTSASGANVSHQFSTPGSYAVSVTADDNRGGKATGSVSVSVASPTPAGGLKINFQLASSPVPAGYLQDNGYAFGNRGNGYSYGWNADNSLAARDRNAANAPDQRYDTLIHMNKPENPNAFWEIAMPNGIYTVRLVSGDPSYFNSVYKINVEGVLTIDATPTSAQRWFENTKTVTVADGRITISSAAGGVINKVCFVEINAVSSRGLDDGELPEAAPLNVSTVQAKLSFAKPGKDGYSVSGSIPGLDGDFAAAGVPVSIDLGAAIVNVVLNDKRLGKTKNGTFSMKFNAKKGWIFRALLKNGSWSESWADGGLDNATVKSAPAELPVTLTIGSQVFSASKAVKYSATEKKTGVAK